MREVKNSLPSFDMRISKIRGPKGGLTKYPYSGWEFVESIIKYTKIGQPTEVKEVKEFSYHKGWGFHVLNGWDLRTYII